MNLVAFILMYLPYIVITVYVINYLQEYLVVGFVVGTIVCKSVILRLFPLINEWLTQVVVDFPEEHSKVKEGII